MKKFILLSLLLSGCTAYVTKENSATFESWELCTLLYDPHSLYSSWISMEAEDNVIRAELKSRGIISKADCSIDSLAKAKCDDLGLKTGTTEYAKCRLDVEQHIELMKQMMKSARDTKETAEAIKSQQIINSYKLRQIQQEQQQQYFEPVWEWKP